MVWFLLTTVVCDLLAPCPKHELWCLNQVYNILTTAAHNMKTHSTTWNMFQDPPTNVATMKMLEWWAVYNLCLTWAAYAMKVTLWQSQARLVLSKLALRCCCPLIFHSLSQSPTVTENFLFPLGAWDSRSLLLFNFICPDCPELLLWFRFQLRIALFIYSSLLLQLKVLRECSVNLTIKTINGI